jgi:hypothetical protein
MTKPAITKRSEKGLALTYAELDTNFQNLKDATFGVTDGTNSKDFDLNSRITFTAGTNITLGVDPTTGAITINANTTGNVQTGLANRIAFYPSNGNTIDDTALAYTYTPSSGPRSDIITLSADAGSFVIKAKNTGNAVTIGDSNGPIQIKPGPGSLSVPVYGGLYTIGLGLATQDIPAGNPHFTSGDLNVYANTNSVFFKYNGMLLITNHSTGSVSLWLLADTAPLKVSESGTGSTGTVTWTTILPSPGFLWTNNSGGSLSISFMLIATRATS